MNDAAPLTFEYLDEAGYPDGVGTTSQSSFGCEHTRTPRLSWGRLDAISAG
jgi:hypothetical protein